MRPGCLTEFELRAVLAGNATKETLASAERHLDTCTQCRAELESLAGSADEFRSLPAHDRGGQPQATPALDRVIRRYAAAPQGDAAETSSQLESTAILQYLTASPDAQSLGRLGDYEVLEVVATGGMGIVLKALDTKLNRVVALKLLAPVLASDPRGRQRFLREARAVAAIDHEHVVGIFAVGETSELPFIAMEFVEGESLAQRLQRDERLRADEVIRIGREVAAGLAAAHARGIIHRDIKPANVLIERATGRVKITDFGLARALDDTGLTRSGFIAGTPEYLSPEQAAGQSLDARSDLFSLGSLLYAACVGESPFRAGTTLAVLRRVADHKPAPVHQLKPGIPRWLSGVIERLLAKDPANRFTSAAELIEVLDAGARGELAEGPDPRSRRRNRRRAVLLSLAALLAIALVLLASARRKPAKRPIVAVSVNHQTLGEYADLREALVDAPAEATVELRWNGELKMDSVELPTRSLVLRAGENFHPIWVHSGISNALMSRAPLQLEGIEFRHLSSGSPSSKQPSNMPRKERRSVRDMPRAKPDDGSFVRSQGGPLTIKRCLFRDDDPGGRNAAIFAAIALENVSTCRVTDSALYLMSGRGIVVRTAQQSKAFEASTAAPPKTSLLLSNCLLFTAQSLWMGLAMDGQAKVQLERSSFKGDSLLFLAAGGGDTISVEARQNLFNSAILLFDQRQRGAEPLNVHMTWEDQRNLFCVNERLMYSESRGIRGNGPPRLPGWKLFWGQTGEGSFEARQPRFETIREPGNSFEDEPPDLGDFRFSFPDGSDGPPKEEWGRYGADLDSFGPPITRSAPQR